MPGALEGARYAWMGRPSGFAASRSPALLEERQDVAELEATDGAVERLGELGVDRPHTVEDRMGALLVTEGQRLAQPRSDLDGEHAHSRRGQRSRGDRLR